MLSCQLLGAADQPRESVFFSLHLFRGQWLVVVGDGHPSHGFSSLHVKSGLRALGGLLARAEQMLDRVVAGSYFVGDGRPNQLIRRGWILLGGSPRGRGDSASQGKSQGRDHGARSRPTQHSGSRVNEYYLKV